MPVAQPTAAAIIEGLANFGIDAHRLGVPRLQEDADLARLWSSAIAMLGRRTLPLEIGLTLPMGAMGAVDYLAASSSTVGAALTAVQQVFVLVGPGVQLVLEDRRGTGRRVVVVDQPPFPGQVESDAFVLGAILGRLRRFASRPIEVTLAELTEPKPVMSRPWLTLLGAPQVRFGACRAALHLSASAWSVPLRTADPRLLATLKALVGVERGARDALIAAVHALARQQLPGLLTLERAAPALGLSRRTLQRKLAACSTTLSDLVDELRRGCAEELAADGHLSLGEVAARLGFAQQASFTRAWRRWFGNTPSKWRTDRRSMAPDHKGG